MADVLLFHPRAGADGGFLAFADELRAAGHVVEWAMEDLPAARELAETIDGAELFLYPGDGHLFADNSLPEYDAAPRRCSSNASSRY